MTPARLIFVGFLLVLAGAVIPFLMVIGTLPTTLWLSFVSYGSSVTGLFVGILGSAGIVSERRRHGDLLERVAGQRDDSPSEV